MEDTKEVTINGITYIPKTDTPTQDGMPYVIVRTYSAGVFAGYLESRNNQEAVIRQARRLWYWDGSASLSQLAVEGTKKPENCKFPCVVDKVELTQVIEVDYCTEVARLSINAVPVWGK